jgi:dTDP-4-amino-4,6-dideoxygalactose transaminase
MRDGRRDEGTVMRVRFLDVAAINARFEPDGSAAAARVIASGRYLFGPETAAFEREFAAFAGARHCVGVANGLDALRLVLRAWKGMGRLRDGDEVGVPANSFIASALAVSDSGLSVRFADVDTATFNLTRQTVEAALTPATRAVMPVHLYGQLADVRGIGTLCRERNLLLLEDAAQAHGAAAEGMSAGAFGDAAGFSFYPGKNLGALGDAGAVTTDDDALAEQVRILGNYGARRKYDHELAGANSRMAEMQAALLRLKLARLAQDNARRREIARRYVAQLAHPQVRVPTLAHEGSSHVWHLFVVRTPRRDALAEYLAREGIETLIHYPIALHRQAPYRHLAETAAVPVAEALQHEVLSLPISPVLTDADVDYVAERVNAWPG